jgi:hypothetical protein
VWIWGDMAIGFGERFTCCASDCRTSTIKRLKAERQNIGHRCGEGSPSGRTQVLRGCATPGQLEYFAEPVLQQHGDQRALRKGRG